MIRFIGMNDDLLFMSSSCIVGRSENRWCLFDRIRYESRGEGVLVLVGEMKKAGDGDRSLFSFLYMGVEVSFGVGKGRPQELLWQGR